MAPYYTRCSPGGEHLAARTASPLWPQFLRTGLPGASNGLPTAGSLCSMRGRDRVPMSTLSPHRGAVKTTYRLPWRGSRSVLVSLYISDRIALRRSEEHTSELQSL